MMQHILGPNHPERSTNDDLVWMFCGVLTKYLFCSHFYGQDYWSLLNNSAIIYASNSTGIPKMHQFKLFLLRHDTSAPANPVLSLFPPQYKFCKPHFAESLEFFLWNYSGMRSDEGCIVRKYNWVQKIQPNHSLYVKQWIEHIRDLISMLTFIQIGTGFILLEAVMVATCKSQGSLYRITVE